MINYLHRSLLWSHGEGGGYDDGWDWLGGGEEPGGDPSSGNPPDKEENQPPANGLTLSDAQLDAIADRVVQRSKPSAKPEGASDEFSDDGENQFLKEWQNSIVSQTLSRLTPFLAETATRRLKEFGDLPIEVVEDVSAALAGMKGEEVLQMLESGGAKLLAHATYGRYILEGKIAPPGGRPATGDSGDGVPSGASPEVRNFIEVFRGFNGRDPKREDAERYGVKL